MVHLKPHSLSYDLLFVFLHSVEFLLFLIRLSSLALLATLEIIVCYTIIRNCGIFHTFDQLVIDYLVSYYLVKLIVNHLFNTFTPSSTIGSSRVDVKHSLPGIGYKSKKFDCYFNNFCSFCPEFSSEANQAINGIPHQILNGATGSVGTLSRINALDVNPKFFVTVCTSDGYSCVDLNTVCLRDIYFYNMDCEYDNIDFSIVYKGIKTNIYFCRCLTPSFCRFHGGLVCDNCIYSLPCEVPSPYDEKDHGFRTEARKSKYIEDQKVSKHLSKSKIRSTNFQTPVICDDSQLVKSFKNVKYENAKTFEGPNRCVGAVFDSSSYRKISLPRWLSELDYKDVPALVGSMVKYKPVPKNPEEAKDFNELHRKLNLCKDSWLDDTVNPDYLRDYLVSVFSMLPEINLRPRDSFPVPPGFKFTADNTLRFPEFDPKYFLPKTNKRKEIPALMANGNEPNIMYDIVSSCNVSSRRLTPVKIRSMLKHMVSTGVSKDEILEVFRHKCYMWKTPKRDTIAWKDTVDISALSWCISYIPPEFMYYKISDDKAFLNVFRSQILIFRDIVLKFVANYLDTSLMTRAERVAVRKARIEAFKTIMRSPPIQRMFASGYSKTEITDHINSEFQSELRKSSLKADAYVDMKKEASRNSERKITKARDAKYHLLEDFRTESGFMKEVVKWIQAMRFMEAMKETYLMWSEAYDWAFGTGNNAKFLYAMSIFAAFSATFYGVWYLAVLVVTIMKFLLFISYRANHVTETYISVQEQIDAVTAVFSKREQILTPEAKLVAVELMHLIHIIYYGMKKDITMVMSHMKFFVVTRPELIRDFLMDFKIMDFASYTSNNSARFHVDGIQYECDKVMLNTVMSAYRVTKDLNPFIDDGTVRLCGVDLRTEAKTISEMVGSLFRLTAKANVFGLSEADMRSAITSFTYINHVGRDASETVNTCTSIVSVLCRTFFGFDPSDQFYSDYSTKILEIIAYVDDLILADSADLNNVKKAEEILSVHNCAVEYSSWLDYQTLPPFLQRKFVERSSKLERFAKEAKTTLKISDIRVEPMFVLFTGPPGVGKTACTKFLEAAICHLDGQQYDASMSYSYNPKSDFWEGYKRQRFVHLDDMFKTTDVDVRSNEATTIIDMINTSTFSLNMAFEGKGSVYFDSEFVFGSTNLANDGIEQAHLTIGLTDPNAFKRRCHLVLHKLDKLDCDAPNARFLVSKCELMPELVGHKYTAVKLAYILREHRNIQKQRHNAHAYTKETLDSYLFPDPFVYDGEDPEIENPPEFFVEDVDDLSDTFINNDFRETQNLTDLRTEANEKNKKAPISSPEKFLSLLMKVMCKDTWDVVNSKTIICIFFALVAAVSAGPAMNMFFPYITESATYKKNLSSGKKGHKVKVPVSSRLKRIPLFNTESARDNYRTSLSTKVAPCIIPIVVDAYIEDVLIYSEYCCTYLLRDNIMVTSAHLLRAFDEYQDVRVTLTIRDKPVTFPLGPCNVIGTLDLALYLLPNGIEKPKSIYKYLITDEEMFNIEEGAPMNMVSCDSYGSTIISNINKADSLDNVKYVKHNEEFLIQHPISYYSHTQPGDSSSIITIEGKQGKVHVVGMHCGSNFAVYRRVGVGIPLSKSFFDGIMTDFTTESCAFPHKTHERVPYNLAHVVPRISKIKRSPLYGCEGEPLCIPAVLHRTCNEDGVVFDPMNKALSKMHQEPFPDFDVPEQTLDYISNLYPRDEGAVVSWEEALVGDTTKGSVGINYGTSPGYPYSLTKTKGKAPYILQGENGMEYDPSFLTDVKNKEILLRSGTNIRVLWADVLKDETLPRAKVLDGKARIISTCPLDFLILVRRYFLDLITFVQKQASQKPVAVGINCHSLQWHELYFRLSRTSQSVLAGDFRNYDGLIPKSLGKGFLKWVNDWYNDGPINAKVRELLLQHIFHAEHICDCNIYRVVDGNPSGNPITSIYNSFCNIMMCYMVLTMDLGLDDDQFEMVVYGDDNVITVNEPNLRCSDLTPHFKRRFGMEYTHYSKSESDVHDTLETIAFLGRRFRKDLSIMRAPLELSVIKEMSYWLRGDAVPEVVLLSVADSIFRELTHHGIEIFKEYSDRFLNAVKTRLPGLYAAICNIRHTYWYYWKEMYSVTDQVRIPFQTESGHSTPFETIQPQIEDNVVDTRNLQFTERAVNEVTDTQEVQLGEYQDAAPITSGSATDSIMQTAYKSTNMETFHMDGSLDREYQIANIPWTSDQAAGTVLATLNMPQLLFSQPYIADKIKDFRFFRGGVRLTIRTAASKFLYGKVIVNWDPIASSNVRTDRYTNLYAATGASHMLISASASEACVFDVPFISFQRALDLQNYANNEIGVFRVIILHSLYDINGNVGSANLLVTAQFLDAELFLPQDFLTESKSGGSKLVESKMKAVKGVITSDLESAKTLASGVNSDSFTSQFKDRFTRIAAPIAAISAMSMLGLSKPTSVQVGQITKINPFMDINYGKGIDMCPKIAMDPENTISTAPIVGGINEDEMALNYIAGVPQMVSSGAFLPGSSAIAIASCNQFENIYSPFCDQIAKHFKWVSGSYKYKIYITASLMHAVRLVFYLQSSNDDGDWQSSYHRVVDVQGDTEVEITAPYINARVAAGNAGLFPWAIWCKVLSWSQPVPAASTPINIAVYKAAANDFRYHGLLDTAFVCQSNPRADFAKDFQPIHPSVTGFTTKGLVMGEEYTTIREIVHRYTPYFTMGTHLSPLYDGVSTAGSVKQGLEIWGTFFRFWRGSIRIKLLNRQSSASVCTAYISDPTNAYPNFAGSMISDSNNPMLEGEIPFYSSALFCTTDSTNYDPRIVIDDTRVTRFLFKAAGDDFSFHNLVGRVPGTVNVPGAARGLVGLATFTSGT